MSEALPMDKIKKLALDIFLNPSLPQNSVRKNTAFSLDKNGHPIIANIVDFSPTQEYHVYFQIQNQKFFALLPIKKRDFSPTNCFLEYVPGITTSLFVSCVKTKMSIPELIQRSNMSPVKTWVQSYNYPENSDDDIYLKYAPFLNTAIDCETILTNWVENLQKNTHAVTPIFSDPDISKELRIYVDFQEFNESSLQILPCHFEVFSQFNTELVFSLNYNQKNIERGCHD